MAKNSIRDYSATASSNTDIQSIDIDENCAASGINNAIREMMADTADFVSGTVGIDVLSLADDDNSAQIKIQAPSAVTTTTTFTLPDGDGDAYQVLKTDGSGTLGWVNVAANPSLIINGAMTISQRGTQTSITSAYTACDRWNFTRSGAAVVDASQSTDVPSGEGFANSLKIDVTTADSSVGAGDFAHVRTRFEGQDLQQLRKGTSEAKSLTLSFWVKSAKTGTHIVELYDLDNTRQVSKSYSINTADTWQNVVLQFPADTTGTFDNDNAASLQVAWWLLAGSTYSSGTLNTSWASSTNANRVVGQVNVMDDAANNFYLTGVKLEVGSTATDFDHSRSYGEELALCQRYFYSTDDSGSLTNYITGGVEGSTSASMGGFVFPTQMRSAPSVAFLGTNVTKFYSAATGTDDSVSVSTNRSSKDIGSFVVTGFTGGTAGQAASLYDGGSGSGITFDAEL